MKKQKTRAFGKDIYLLGADKDGTKYWLESPSWDCDWYWGFGYIETYTNNDHPEWSRDICSHEHADGKYDSGNTDGTHDDNLFTGDFLVDKTFNEKEGWKLRELFETFYLLRKIADFRGRGGCHISSNPLHELLKDENAAKKVNEQEIPKVTEAILAILS